jgi:hypothetical protein
MTENQSKEKFSLAYVQAVASRVGYSCTTPAVDDDSVDLHVSAVGYIDSKAVVRSPSLQLQLKATARRILKGDHLSFSLSKKNYEDLRDPNSIVPRLLVVLLMPEKMDDWIDVSEEQMLLRYGAYWLCLEGLPLHSKESITVHVPRVNLFTPGQLQALMVQAARGESLCNLR